MAGPQAPQPGPGWGKARGPRRHVSRVPVGCPGWRSSGSLQPRPSPSLFLLMLMPPQGPWSRLPRGAQASPPMSTGASSRAPSLASGPHVCLPSDVSTFTSLTISRDSVHHPSKQADLSPSASQDREVKVIPPLHTHTHTHKTPLLWGFPSGPVVKKPPCNARDNGLIPGLGKSHRLQSN